MPAPSDSYGNLIWNESGLVSYWRVGESSGTSAADSKGTNTGTYKATPTLGVTGILADVGVDTAITLNGSTQYVSVPFATSNQLGNGPWTLEAWVKLSATQSVQRGIISKNYYLRINSSNQIEVLWSTNSSILNTTTTLTDTASWHHIVATRDSTASPTTHIYVDGAEPAHSSITATTIVNTDRNLLLGADNTGGPETPLEYFNGSLDELAIYNVALSSSTVLAHYNAGVSSGLPPGKPTVARAALPPHDGDNWTFTRSLSRGFDTVPPKMPPGLQPVVTPAAVPPHASDNWTFTGPFSRGFDTPQAPMPIGLQPVVTPAALPPHTGDNWTYVASLNRGFDTVPAKMPPGVPLVTPAALPPHLTDNWTYVASLNCAFASPMPMGTPGQPVVTPAAISPHAGDNWTVIDGVYPRFVVLGKPIGMQVLTPNAISPHAGDDWSSVQGVVVVPVQPVSPKGAQAVDPAMPNPRAKDNWTFIARSSQPLMNSTLASMPRGVQLVSLPPFSGVATNWTQDSTQFPGMVPVQPPPGQQKATVQPRAQQMAENWTLTQSVPIPRIAQSLAPLPPGRQITNYVLVWRQAPNYSYTRALNLPLNTTIVPLAVGPGIGTGTSTWAVDPGTAVPTDAPGPGTASVPPWALGPGVAQPVPGAADVTDNFFGTATYGESYFAS